MIHFRKRLLIVLLAGTISACSSDNGRSRLTGTVLLDGEPLPRYQVALISAEGRSSTAVAGTFTDDNGKYEIANVLPGKYKVIIREFKGPYPSGAPVPKPAAAPILIPAKYSDPLKTELAVDLKGGRQAQDFVLTKNP